MCIVTVIERTFTSRDIIRVVEKEGWSLAGVRGSHYQFKHLSKAGRVSLPHPKKDFKIGTAKTIADQAGLKLSDF